MSGGGDFFRRLRRHFLQPSVSDEQLDAELARIHERLPVPVIWLLGKAQSGKTSIIRALTGSSRAEIGSGFRPCTRTAEIYPFPNEQECFLHFLDTRGLGEVDYDPSEDIAAVEQQAHVVIVVVRAMDHALQSVIGPLQKIRKAHPQWPLIVAQTCLHDGYPPQRMEHIRPYPFAEPPYPPEVPADLARSLAEQRTRFAGFDARFVPVDFTLPEDGFEPEHYGLEALWSAIEEGLPLGLRGMLQREVGATGALRDVYLRAAQPHIVSYSIAAGTAAAVPVPLVDVPLILGIQAKMFHAIASIYDQPMSRARMAEITGALGLGYLARLGGREVLKVIPGVGSAAAALYAGATTYALGRTLCRYFSDVRAGHVPDTEQLRELYERHFEAGRRHLQRYFRTVSDQDETGETP